MKSAFWVLLLGISTNAMGQVAINNTSTLPHASAMLDISSTNRGLLVPRMTQAQRNAIVSPATGLMIYQTDATAGYYYNSGTPASPSWTKMGELVLPYAGTISTADVAFKITNTGASGAFYGVATSSAGIGIYGNADFVGSGTAVGVKGSSASSEGSGLLGVAQAVTGNNIGVYGQSHSTGGTGVYGEALAVSGSTIGISGYTNSPTGYGVYGRGNTGVYGVGYLDGSVGVVGSNTNALGNGIGVKGASASQSGYGIYGESPGHGVYGKATAAMGSSIGVHGETGGYFGYGVRGVATTTEGNNIGVYGTTYSPDGAGIKGENLSATGYAVGIWGLVTSPNGYSGYFSGGSFHLDGRMGIGILSPGAGIHLKATGYPNSFMFLQSDDNQDAGFRLYEGTVDQWHIFNSSSIDGLQIYNHAGTTAFFAKQSNGYVGIGTTAPTQLLDVNGVARVRGMMTGVVATTVYRTSDGTLITGASDIRLKENIEPLQNSLDKVLQLKGVSFNWKADPQKRRSIGFVAQDFEKALPELVFTNDNDGYKGINYAEVTAVLAEALKELNARHEQLLLEFKQLKAMVEKMQAGMSKEK